MPYTWEEMTIPPKKREWIAFQLRTLTRRSGLFKRSSRVRRSAIRQHELSKHEWIYVAASGNLDGAAAGQSAGGRRGLESGGRSWPGRRAVPLSAAGCAGELLADRHCPSAVQ